MRRRGRRVGSDDIAIGDPNLADPWVRAGIGDPSARLADRDGDGLVCSSTLRPFGRPVGRMLTDYAIGASTTFPPDPCTDPFRMVSIGDPNVFPWNRQRVPAAERLAAARLTASAAVVERYEPFGQRRWRRS